MTDFVDLELTPKCNTCKSCFANINKIKDHYRGEWHILNSKRRANGLFPLKRSEFKAIISSKIRKSTQGTVYNEKPPNPNDVHISETIAENGEIVEGEPTLEKVEPEEPKPPAIGAHISIFDDKEFENVEDCVTYMANSFGFFIPDIEYLVDLEGMLVYLGEKVKLGGYCLYCQKLFTPGKPCQDHMTSKSHCKVRYENGIDGEEFEDFYDFSSSYEDMEDVEFDEDGNVVEGGMTIASTGEMVLADGRIIGHRNFRRYYKQYYRPVDTRAPILALQREELLRLGGKFGGLSYTPEEVESMEDVNVMSLLVKYHKDIRKGMIVEQRAQKQKEFRNQRLEYSSKQQKALNSEIITRQIRDYHGMLK
jgi:pre-60S factor REI1